MNKSTLILSLIFFTVAICLPIQAIECRDNSPCPRVIKTLYSQALNGSPDAQIMIGNMYREGKFFKRNSKKVFQWFEQASRHTPIITIPNYEVGISYLLGQGTKQRIYKGIQHLEKAAEAGSIIAQLILASEYLTGNHVAINYKKARSYFLQASNAGDLYAIYTYGVMLKLGLGGSKDTPNAERLIKMAVAKNYPIPKLLVNLIESASDSIELKTEQLKTFALSEEQKILSKIQSFSLGELNDLDKLAQIADTNERWLSINKKKGKSLPMFLFEYGILFEI
ncbi:MAG: sel1 repeat family protein [Kangiellaceae bacterium]|nr:sel1 repeat family protein [Kangiellaceae bacterium]MCW9017362.1 sel1 repeat family protein [Kangiellaceae bacterium]